MNTAKVFCWIALTTIFTAMPCFAQIAVIVHPDNHEQLTPAMVRSIFLGKVRVFNNGLPIFAIGIVQGDPARDEFERSVLRKTPSDLNAYWNTVFSHGNPPDEVENSSTVVELVAENRFAIGYIDIKNVNERVKVLDILQ